ncbi:MAG: hypothetical protein ACI91O_001472 [Candidatus Poriferisodalaceae bacterium]|jgi:hypothetical protein
MSSATLVGDEVAHGSLGGDAAFGFVALSTNWSANDSRRDEFCETVIDLVEGRESSNGTSAVGDDDLFPVAYSFDVLTEAVLELANSNL